MIREQIESMDEIGAVTDEVRGIERHGRSATSRLKTVPQSSAAQACSRLARG